MNNKDKRILENEHFFFFPPVHFFHNQTSYRTTFFPPFTKLAKLLIWSSQKLLHNLFFRLPVIKSGVSAVALTTSPPISAVCVPSDASYLLKMSVTVDGRSKGVQKVQLLARNLR